MTVPIDTNPALNWSKVRGPEVRPERLVTEVNRGEYAAALFFGGHVREHTDEATPANHAAVERIMREMNTAPKRVGAIGDGQPVLKDFGLVTKPRPSGAGTDGRVITTAWGDAAAFADEVLAALAK